MPIYTNENGLVDETPCDGCGWPLCSCLCSDIEYMTEGGHKIQIGGSDGNGYCYVHQSFDCLEKLNSI